MLEIGTGYLWDIRGVFTEYSWGIRMYRVCVGYVSGMYREFIERNRMRNRMRKGAEKSQNIVKHLVMSVKFSTFAGGSDLHYQNCRILYKIVKK